MSSSVFRFKQFSIDQNGCGMKISTDGILFGSWIPADGKWRILDVGAGTGLISLMLAQRFSDAKIDAVELDKNAIEKSKENFRNSPWSDRLNLIPADFNRFHSEEKYDLVVSNPPFFSTNHRYSSAERELARNTFSLSMEALVSNSSLFTSESGSLAVILPVEVEREFLKKAQSAGFSYLWRKATIQSKPQSSVTRVMLIVSKLEAREVVEEKFIVHKEDGSYTDQFKALTKDFYL